MIKRLVQAGVGIMLGGLGLGLGTLWWWAVAGMSYEVGVASAATSICLVIVGLTAVLVGSDA